MAEIPHTPAFDSTTSSAHNTEIRLLKGAHEWSFCWDVGDEAELLDAITRLAREPEVPFDWFDAAVVARHVGLPTIATGNTSLEN